MAGAPPAALDRVEILLTFLFLIFPDHINALTTYELDSIANNCKITGDSDIYGLGVRLGFYLTWAGGLISGAFKRAEYVSALVAMDILTLAVFIATAVGAGNRDKTKISSIDLYITSNLIIGLNGGLSVFLFLAGELSSGGIYLLAHLMALTVTIALEALNLWLVFAYLPTASERECDPKVFFFRSVFVYSGWLTFSKIFWICALLLSSFFLLTRILKERHNWQDGRGIGDQIAPTDPDSPDEVRIAGMVWGVFATIWSICPLVFVELTIQINHIEFESKSLANSGQLIALLVGVFTVLLSLSSAEFKAFGHSFSKEFKKSMKELKKMKDEEQPIASVMFNGMVGSFKKGYKESSEGAALRHEQVEAARRAAAEEQEHAKSSGAQASGLEPRSSSEPVLRLKRASTR